MKDRIIYAINEALRRLDRLEKRRGYLTPDMEWIKLHLLEIRDELLPRSEEEKPT